MPEARATQAEERGHSVGILDAALPGLYATPPEPLPFGHALEIRAFLLRRTKGNILLYSVRNLEAGADDIAELGGISRHYLNHRHEAGFASGWLEAPLFVHQNERESVVKSYRIEGTFAERHHLDEDFEIIPAPGHTSGATVYRWDSGSHRFLFTGDTICLSGGGEWTAAVLGSSDRHSYLESLELIRGLEFDVLVPWVATQREPYLSLTSRADARQRIDRIIARVRRGDDH